MWTDYQNFLRTPPEQVLEWYDPPTGARGWLVINSLRGGAAGGGTRMRRGVTREEVVYLAKAMELKFAFSGPPIGGAKSAIDFDPSDPRRDEVLERWFRAICPMLKEYYGTAGDVGVDEHRDVTPLCEQLGLEHPQEGVVRGHLSASDAEVRRVLGNLRRGVGGLVVAPELALTGRQMFVGDLITGYGTARAAARLMSRAGDSIEGKRVIVEGFGNVGAACAIYLARFGARIVSLIDASHAIVAKEGLDADQVQNLVVRRRNRVLPEHPQRITGNDRNRAYRVDADIFVPAAISASIDEERLGQLTDAGVETIVCGANQPFDEEHLGDTHTQSRADVEFRVIADSVGSLGMARAFFHLMGEAPDTTDVGVFRAVGDAMDQAVDQVVERAGNPRRGLLEAAVQEALDRVKAA